MDVPDITIQIDDPLPKQSDILPSETNEKPLPNVQYEQKIIEPKIENEIIVDNEADGKKLEEKHLKEDYNEIDKIENIRSNENILKSVRHESSVGNEANGKTNNLEENNIEIDKSNIIENDNTNENDLEHVVKEETSDGSQINGNTNNNSLDAKKQIDVGKINDSTKYNAIGVKKQYKKRRRIIITESNSDAESEVEFNSISEPEPVLESSTSENEESVSEEEEEEEILVPEKPKPKCKKQSTIIKKQLEIKKLLENAVIIPAPPIKCSISRAVISSSDEKEEDNDRTCKTPPVLLRCNKRKLFESSSSHESESDSNILITEPIPDSSYENFEIDDEPIPEIVLPPHIIATESVEAENENEEKDPIKTNGNDILESKMIFSSSANSEDEVPSNRMPNSVYFGDVDVPLNVLYSYEEENELKSASMSDESSDESTSEKNIKRINNNNRNIRRHKSKGPSRNIPSGRSELDKLRACVKAANIKIKYTKLFEDCTNDRERAEAIRDLLEDYGLRGEPTIAKCRRLKKKTVRVKKEIADLDRSAIIESSGRTLRSAGVVHKSENFPDLYGQELLKRTMNTIRNLVDTDSD